MGKKCSRDGQPNTLIPYSLVHSGLNRDSYRRLEWNGLFCPTTTEVNPTCWQVLKIIILNLVIK